MNVRAPQRRRPLRRAPGPIRTDVDLSEIAERVSYVGSGEHKTFPSFAGPPQPQADATKCDPALGDKDELTRWLQTAIIKGQIGGQWDNDFPRYAWLRIGDVYYEARLVNKVLGQYKGYSLVRSEWPTAFGSSNAD